MTDHIRRPGVREGYDLWADSYDSTENPLVFLDRTHALAWLAPKNDERILDLGCGTGIHLQGMRERGALPFGTDLSSGMIRRAFQRVPDVPVCVADMQSTLPFRSKTFDAVLCSLVSEHLKDLTAVWKEAHRILRNGGRFIVTAFHPHLAHGGTEANFSVGDIEYRLGAELHTLEDYRIAMTDAGFSISRWEEIMCDASVVEAVPRASRYLGRPMLLLMEGRTADEDMKR